jgi:hypothetical protein
MQQACWPGTDPLDATRPCRRTSYTAACGTQTRPPSSAPWERTNPEKRGRKGGRRGRKKAAAVRTATYPGQPSDLVDGDVDNICSPVKQESVRVDRTSTHSASPLTLPLSLSLLLFCLLKPLAARRSSAFPRTGMAGKNGTAIRTRALRSSSALMIKTT